MKFRKIFRKKEREKNPFFLIEHIYEINYTGSYNRLQANIQFFIRTLGHPQQRHHVTIEERGQGIQ